MSPELSSASPRNGSGIHVVPGLAALADRYDLLLCDVWGVLHDGLVGFADARDALVRFRGDGGTVVLVSNAPRPGHVVGEQLARFGTGPDAYDAIVTSGDLTREVVRSRAGQGLFHLGPNRDRGIYDGLEVRFAEHGSCDYVVCTGLVDDDTDSLDDYGPLLREMRARDLWMLCANPDIVVERGDTLLYCAGALASAYAELGGETFYAGKPHRPVYEEAVAQATTLRGGAVERSRILAVGDAMRTDVAGAAAFGIDSLLVARGIHAAPLGYRGGALDEARALEWLAEHETRPTFLAGQFSWDGSPPAR